MDVRELHKCCGGARLQLALIDKVIHNTRNVKTPKQPCSVRGVVKMASLSSESSRSQQQRRPQVGLSNPRGVHNPRSARGQANEQEIVRRALQAIARDESVSAGLEVDGLDDSGSEPENSMNYLSEASENVYEEREYQDNGEEQNPDDDHDARLPPPASPIAERLRERNRYFWAGNDAKLNMMANKYLNQPLRQEIAANASHNAEFKSQIRSLKRLPNQDLDHDNLKHSGTI